MSSTQQPSYHDQRVVARKPFVAHGSLTLPDGRQVAVQTVDASVLGAGLTHREPLGEPGLTATLQVSVSVPGGPASSRVQMKVQLRHTTAIAGGWRSGMQFVGLSSEDKAVWEAALGPRQL